MAQRPPSVQFDISTLGIIPLLRDSSHPDWPSAILSVTERVLKYWGCDLPALALESASPCHFCDPWRAGQSGRPGRLSATQVSIYRLLTCDLAKSNYYWEGLACSLLQPTKAVGRESLTTRPLN